MTANHLRYDLYMAGFFLRTNGSIKDRIHHVKYHPGTNIFSVRTECVTPWFSYFHVSSLDPARERWPSEHNSLQAQGVEGN